MISFDSRTWRLLGYKTVIIDNLNPIECWVLESVDDGRPSFQVSRRLVDSCKYLTSTSIIYLNRDGSTRIKNRT